MPAPWRICRKGRPLIRESSDRRRSSCYRFALVTDGSIPLAAIERDFLQRGVIVRRPVKQLCHRALRMDTETCPNAETLFDRVLSLPLYPSLSEQEQDVVIAAARSVLT